MWPVKSRQISIKKLPKKDFPRKMKDFWHLYKSCLKCGQFGQNNCCHRLWKDAQSAINRPIWSRCSLQPQQKSLAHVGGRGKLINRTTKNTELMNMKEGEHWTYIRYCLEAINMRAALAWNEQKRLKWSSSGPRSGNVLTCMNKHDECATWPSRLQDVLKWLLTSGWVTTIVEIRLA